MHLKRIRTLASITCLLGATAFADWPQYRGPEGNGISAEKMRDTWPAGGPRVLWTKSVGAGIGSFAMKDGKAYFLAADGQNERLHAVQAATGNEVWSCPIGPTQIRSSGNGGPGPCSTPVADGDKIYVYSSKLNLVCVSAADGKIVWEHNVQREFRGQAESASAISRWGSAASPVVVDDLVIVQGGGSGQHYLAFNKQSGALAWKHDTQVLTQSTPAVATIHGVKQVIFLQQSGLVSIEPATGATLWKQPYESATAIGPSPVVSGDTVYISIGYNVGAAAFQVSKSGESFSVKQIWRTPRLNMNWWSTPVIKDGYVYSIHGRGDDAKAPLQCVDLATGQVKWSGPPAGGGEIVIVDGKIIVQAGTGKLHLVQPDPSGYKEISTAQPISGQAWGWPAYSDGIFLYRTTREAVALDLSPQ